MSEERKKILDMLSEKKITAKEAEKLLSAISTLKWFILMSQLQLPF